MEQLPPPDNYDGSEAAERFDEAFRLKLAAGEVEYDHSIEAETISGLNENGEIIKIYRPGLDAEPRVNNKLKHELRYMVEVSQPHSEDQDDSSYKLVIWGDGKVIYLHDEGGSSIVESDPEVDKVLRVIFW